MNIPIAEQTSCRQRDTRYPEDCSGAKKVAGSAKYKVKRFVDLVFLKIFSPLIKMYSPKRSAPFNLTFLECINSISLSQVKNHKL